MIVNTEYEFCRCNGIPPSVGRLHFIDPSYICYMSRDRRSLDKPVLSATDLDQSVSLPPFWLSSMEFDQCLETGLHLVNLGAVNRIEEAAMTWLASTSSFQPKVGRAVNAIMEDISNQNLDWFRLECFQTSEYTHGGWVRNGGEAVPASVDRGGVRSG